MRAAISLFALFALVATTLEARASSPPAALTDPAVTFRAAADGRLTTETVVNGAGPFRFLIDTGANRTAVSPALVERLALSPTGTGEVLGVTGAVSAPLVRLRSVEAGALALQDVEAPVVGVGALGGADGVLAASDISRFRVTFDMRRRHVHLDPPARLLPRRWREARLPARFQSGAIVRIPVMLDGVAAEAVIDTGSEYTLINGPLHAALRAASAASRVGEPREVTSVSEVTARGMVIRMPVMSLGAIVLDGFAAVAVEDLEVLRRWGLAERPAMILGMNVINALDTLTIDYAAKRVYMSYTVNRPAERLRPDPLMTVRR